MGDATSWEGLGEEVVFELSLEGSSACLIGRAC